MPKLRIDNETFRFMSAFAKLTGVSALDCLKLNDSELVFVVEPGKMGAVIGKKGVVIRKVEDILGKHVKVVEYANDPVKFVLNLIHPVRPRNVYLSERSDGTKVVNLELDSKGRRMLFGNGKKIYNLTITLLKRHFPDVEVRVA